MRYLRLPRAWILLLSFLGCSLLLAIFPAIDLRISGLFFDGMGFHLANEWWVTVLHESVSYLISLTLAIGSALYAFNKYSKRRDSALDGRRMLFLFLVLILGAGLVVNVLFKNNFGRARPKDVAEFGGTHRFTSAFAVSGECATNCSFSSGDGAGAFFFVAVALGLSRRRSLLLVALGYGALVSYSRVAAGAHFFSDSIVSLFVMLLVTEVLACYLLFPGPVAIAARGLALSPDGMPPAGLRVLQDE